MTFYVLFLGGGNSKWILVMNLMNKSRIKMMRRVTGGGMTTSGGSGLNILGGYFPILVQLLR